MPETLAPRQASIWIVFISFLIIFEFSCTWGALVVAPLIPWLDLLRLIIARGNCHVIVLLGPVLLRVVDLLALPRSESFASFHLFASHDLSRLNDRRVVRGSNNVISLVLSVRR